MKWWKRLLFSVISFLLGFASLDYLIHAFQLLVNTSNETGKYNLQKDAPGQLFGALLFLLWFVVIFFYYFLIRKSSNQIDMIVRDKKTGKDKIQKKWFDLIFQTALLLTGIFLRWCYLIYIYFPNC